MLDSYVAEDYFELSQHYVALTAGNCLCSVRKGWQNHILQIKCKCLVMLSLASQRPQLQFFNTAQVCSSGQHSLKVNCFYSSRQYSDLIRLQQPELPSASTSSLTWITLLCLCSGHLVPPWCPWARNGRNCPSDLPLVLWHYVTASSGQTRSLAHAYVSVWNNKKYALTASCLKDENALAMEWDQVWVSAASRSALSWRHTMAAILTVCENEIWVCDHSSFLLLFPGNLKMQGVKESCCLACSCWRDAFALLWWHE